MPSVTETPVKAYAHCGNPICPGNAQEQVDALERTSAFSYQELGGDIPGDERSTVSFVFADEGDAPCSHCGRELRELSGSPRPQYENLSGFDPEYLRGLAAGLVPEAAGPSSPDEIAELRAQVEALAAQLKEK